MSTAEKPSADAGRGELTPAQRTALLWLPQSGGYRNWGGALFGSPSKAALQACIKRGWAEKVGHPDMELYARTDAGREALSQEKAG